MDGPLSPWRDRHAHAQNAKTQAPAFVNTLAPGRPHFIEPKHSSLDFLLFAWRFEEADLDSVGDCLANENAPQSGAFP